jgi:hypothetical protein
MTSNETADIPARQIEENVFEVLDDGTGTYIVIRSLLHWSGWRRRAVRYMEEGNWRN